jgi:multicomponent Na+:H+ antiporter subunit G
MAEVLPIATMLLVLAGTFFSVLGVTGYVRLPDVYTRLHATGKVTVFGAVFLLFAAMAWTPRGLGKGLVVIALLLLAGPVTAHALASAAYHIGIPLTHAVRDDLAAKALAQVGRGPIQEADLAAGLVEDNS